ncbi:MAG: hypothetical protein H6Q72_4280 [Firmicutes bacterium]|nr:hypothetical protein [Bacillota bacterium]
MNVNVIQHNGLFGMNRSREKQVNQLFKALITEKQNRIEKANTTQGITTGTGLNYYDLQAGAKLLYPVLSPFRNELPRVKGNGGTATHWKAVTGVNVANLALGISEGQRNAFMSITEKDYLATYASIGLDNFVNFEADESSENFEDVKALASRSLLQSMMMGEEKIIVGGNASVSLGTTPTPSLAAGTAGSLAAGTYSVICVALTYDGLMNSSITGGVPNKISRNNADGSTDTYGGGSAIQSSSATVTTTGTSGSIAASVTAVQGAFGYAWYWGASGSEKLGAITTINSVAISADAAGSQLATALDSSDWSTNSKVFDGYLTQICNSDSGSYFKSLATGTAGTGTTLTSNGAGGITEIDEALLSFWENYKLSPDEIVVSSQELQNITNKVIAGGGTPLFRFNVDGQNGTASDVTVTAGAIVGSYLNKFAMDGGVLIPVRLHPYMPKGTIMFRKKTIPYPLSNVTNIAEIRYLRDYYQIAWPIKTRRYEYGVYAREVMPIYFLPAFGAITNIANG